MATLNFKAALLDKQIKEGRKQILAITSDARRNIELQILKAVERGDFIKAATIRDSLYKGIAAEYVKLNGGVDDWVESRSAVVSEAWHGFAIKDLPASEANFTFNQFSEKYLNDIVGKINPSTIGNKVAINPRIQGMMTSDIRAIRTAVSDVIREGALTGMNSREMTKAMIAKAQDIKPAVKFVDAAGRTWDSESYFSMLNSTLHATVARETYTDTAVELGYDLYTIDGGPSSGEANDPCNDWYGKVVSLTGATPGYPTVADAEAAGVWHPRCVHTLGVYIPDEKPTKQAEEA